MQLKPAERYVRPELVELKDAILERVPRISVADAEDRINSVVTSLCSGKIDVPRMFQDFGVPAGHLDVPKKCSLASLYHKPNITELGKTRVFTFCLGMLPVDGDPEVPFVRAHWRCRNYPEGRRKDVSFVPEDVCCGRAHSKVIATCSGKFHVILPEDGRPFMLIYPIQFNDPEFYDAMDGLKKIRESTLAKEGLREVDHRMSLMRKGGSPFRHGNRNLVMGLIGLEAARALGIMNIMLPSRKILERSGELNSSARKLDGQLRDLRLIGRYDELENFLKKTPGFTVSRWDGED